MADTKRLSPDCWGCLRAEGRVVVRCGVFLLPELLEALGREVALVRLREGEDARVAMERRVGDGRDYSEFPRR
jgi:hypothetical protein